MDGNAASPIGSVSSIGKPCRIPWRGVLALLGGFIIQLTLGSFYSFGNMMTYMTSYMRYRECNTDGRKKPLMGGRKKEF